MIGVRDLNRQPRKILERVEGGEVLCICRNGRPVALLQPLGGAVVQSLPGSNGAVLWTAESNLAPQVDELTTAEQALLLWGVRQGGRMTLRSGDEDVPYGELADGIRSLVMKGLARRPRSGGTWITGRGMVLREALCARRRVDIDADRPKLNMPPIEWQ